MDDDRAEFEARVGAVLGGKWRLERLLGVGGMAAVYAARHTIGRLDAIKILHPEIARSAELRARFVQEAHAVNRLQHPGAVAIQDLDTTPDGEPFMVMELLDGEPLSAYARRRGTLDPAEILRYADDLLDVLAAAHAQGIIHRDVKPDNLFILRDGRLKVLDFGIARMREGSPAELKTRTGATLGTVSYMPPEQITGKKIDARADLFAVGATMFRLITDRRLHEARSEQELLVKMATQQAPPLASVAPAAPREICLVVDRALAFDREQRYPDARTMQADIRAVRGGQAPPYAAACAAGAAPGPAPAAAPVAAPPGAGVSAPPVSAPTPSAGTSFDLGNARTVMVEGQQLPHAGTMNATAAATATATATGTGSATALLAALRARAAALLARAEERLPPPLQQHRKLLLPLLAMSAVMLVLGTIVGLWCAGGASEGDAGSSDKAPGAPSQVFSPEEEGRPFGPPIKGKRKRKD